MATNNNVDDVGSAKMDDLPLEDLKLEEVFRRRVDMLNERAKKAGTNITQLCRLAGVSRTTPERWNKRVPKSIGIFDLMFEALVSIEKEQNAEEEAFASLSPREQKRLKALQEEQERERERQRRERRNESRRQSRARQKGSSQD
ncbi:hypothetical protein EU642_22185 [Salmonella enterica]|nr:hypothetical protein [Salmonella enterica]EAO0118564.1 hypothetical protein [Salmonella enterica]EAO3601668.1 hypothetical protein [Salmonella enterica]EAR6391562.1 hypothetical protein [Salmonella enterica]EAV1285326.1 hypothetical protein [Salmonella enterica]